MCFVDFMMGSFNNINEQIWGFEKSLHHSFRFELFELNITAAQ